MASTSADRRVQYGSFGCNAVRCRQAEQGNQRGRTERGIASANAAAAVDRVRDHRRGGSGLAYRVADCAAGSQALYGRLAASRVVGVALVTRTEWSRRASCCRVPIGRSGTSVVMRRILVAAAVLA